MKIVRIILICLFGLVVIKLGLRFAAVTGMDTPQSDIYRPQERIDIALPTYSLKDSCSRSRNIMFLPGGGRGFLSADNINDIVKQSGGRLYTDSSGKLMSKVFKDFGFVMVQKTNGDLGLAIAYQSAKDPSKNVVFEIPSAKLFCNFLRPEYEQTVNKKRNDLPYYPGTKCRIFLDQGRSGFVVFLHNAAEPESIFSFYDREMQRKKWNLVHQKEMETFKIYKKNGALCVLDIIQNHKEGGTDINILVSH